MRTMLAITSLALLAACGAEREGSSEQQGWQPAPIADAIEPSEITKAAPAAAWRAIEPENLLIMDLADGGRIAIELAPDFAPVHVANVRAFARGGWWDGATIYRVQDNYVAQWGLNAAERPFPAGVQPKPPAEYDRPLEGLAVRALGFPDSYAPMAGHAAGWPIGYDPASGRAWLAHCYATVGVGRDLSPDTGSGGELYAVIGHAPRHLDRNIATIGRVVEGIESLSGRPRGTEPLGFYKERASDIAIARVRLAADIPEAERPRYEVMRSDSDAFGLFVTGRANRGGDFFDVPAGGVDLCNVPVPSRRAP